ncbi:Hypothetical predicted protein [Paramuricea clavata]|uniref:Endonuclease/exonuclease/phosphatase domain-containing protein n=1 Tax=Paramuricea clavata TaxID=317549 RepID=A0A6S7GB39_PARCT|nr:Hypothetical predicted protein [Paramuricea clavata]
MLTTSTPISSSGTNKTKEVSNSNPHINPVVVRTANDACFTPIKVPDNTETFMAIDQSCEKTSHHDLVPLPKSINHSQEELTLQRQSCSSYLHDRGQQFRSIPVRITHRPLPVNPEKVNKHRRAYRSQESLNIKRNVQEVFRSFEYLDSSFLNFLHIRIIVVYRPPPSSANSLTSTLFFEEFSSFLEGIIVSPGQLLIAGDFNFHLDNPNDPLTKRFVDLLASFDLKQYISGSTHASGHTLDLIITRSEENIVNHYNIFDPLISDHSVVHLQLLIRKPKFVKKHLLLRNLRAVNIHKFKTDVLNSFLLKNFTTMDLVSLVNEYDCLHTILDNHAPIKSREITLRPKAPWYTNEINDKKRIWRQLERKWHKTRTNADWNRYKQQCYAVNKLIDSSKSAYSTDLINNGSSDQKTLFKTVSNLLHTNTIIRYPSSPDPMSLANSFSDFFTQKIVKIRGDIENELLSKNIENPIPDADSCPYEFHTFREVGKDEVLHLIQRIATKSCSLDPLPVVMLNHCFKDILPVVARIINLSLESGTMPDSLKIAVVQPLLKKYNLSYEEFCSFRPISNLKFVSKFIEKAVAVQLTDYLTENHLHEKFQSAYKPCHSTETALLRVQNDILQALDNGDSVILVLLDLSAAFDTVDHLRGLSTLIFDHTGQN